MCENLSWTDLDIHSWGYREKLILSLYYRSKILRVHSSVTNHTLLYTWELTYMISVRTGNVQRQDARGETQPFPVSLSTSAAQQKIMWAIDVIKIFLVAMFSKCEIHFNNIFHLTQYIQSVITSSCNQYKNYCDILLFLFLLSLQNLVFILHLQHNSIQTSLISRAQ